jgi:hypothetical protein
MPDWRKHVERHLQSLEVSGEREEEIRAELAEHLKDTYQSALRRGLSPEAAMARAQEQVPDWRKLAGRIRRASREEDAMSHMAKTIWLPGVAMLSLATLWLVALMRMVPPGAWQGPQMNELIAPKALWMIIVPWLVAYLAFGAVGAYWSRRAGGSLAARLLSGTFPLTMHLATIILPILVAVFSTTPKFPEHLQVAFLMRVSVFWVLIPGIALTLGTLPFLRERKVA